jgi:hypothetical protein
MIRFRKFKNLDIQFLEFETYIKKDFLSTIACNFVLCEVHDRHS